MINGRNSLEICIMRPEKQLKCYDFQCFTNGSYLSCVSGPYQGGSQLPVHPNCIGNSLSCIWGHHPKEFSRKVPGAITPLTAFFLDQFIFQTWKTRMQYTSEKCTKKKRGGGEASFDQKGRWKFFRSFYGQRVQILQTIQVQHKPIHYSCFMLFSLEI